MFKNIFSLDSVEKNRKLAISKSAVFFSFVIAIFFSLNSYLSDNMELFYYDLALFVTLLSLYLLLKHKEIYFLGNIFLYVMTLGFLLFIFIEKDQIGVTLWIFTLIFYYMILFGHKGGTIFIGILFVITFSIVSTWIGESISIEFYIRYVIISISVFILTFIYEYSISKNIERLNNIQEELERITRIDSLTGVYNRRYFDEIFPKLLNIAARDKKEIVFAMLDVDYFKKYNDCYGHQAGDNVLKKLTEFLTKNFKRAGDYVFRLGGEEFGILYLHEPSSSSNPLKIIYDICNGIENLKIEHKKNIASSFVTISVGVYKGIPCKKCSYDEIYKLTDDALYIAKKEGRNRVVVA